MPEQTIVSATFVSPTDKEKQEAIIKAVCQYYSITEDDLKNGGQSMALTAIRRECYYLILTNTVIKDKAIGKRLNTGRYAINYSKGIIETHKTIYQQTRNNLTAIASLANTFEKTTEWHIH